MGLESGAAPDVSAPLDDVRTGLLGAISRRFGDHLVEWEVSRSTEDDYVSNGFALKDVWELNEKNTTLTFGINYLNDDVSVPTLGIRDKKSYDFFAGVNQILDKNTLVSAALTVGYSDGYLNDPYKAVQRTEIIELPDGEGGTISFPVVNLYPENHPDSRFRQVLQLGARHYFDCVHGAADVMYRFSHDDFGINSHTVQLEWRQSLGDRIELTPFFRYYHQSAADFFVNTFDGVPVESPSNTPDGSAPNYSADYRLSNFDAVSGGLKLRWTINETLSASAVYERYGMSGNGGADSSPSQSYIDADMWTFGLTAKF